MKIPALSDASYQKRSGNRRMRFESGTEQVRSLSEEELVEGEERGIEGHGEHDGHDDRNGADHPGTGKQRSADGRWAAAQHAAGDDRHQHGDDGDDRQHADESADVDHVAPLEGIEQWRVHPG